MLVRLLQTWASFSSWGRLRSQRVWPSDSCGHWEGYGLTAEVREPQPSDFSQFVPVALFSFK